MIEHAIEKIRALAQTGLNYSIDLPYHRDLYKEILLSCLNIASQSAQVSLDRWKNIVKELGVITPKVGCVIAIARDDGALLVLQRPTGRWCLPCGYADIGETPEATALRETHEETQLTIKLCSLLDVTTTSDDAALPFMWELVYIARISNGSLQLSHEHISAEWIQAVDERCWHSTHRAHVVRAFDFLHKNVPESGEG